MSLDHVVRFGAGTARRYLAGSAGAGSHNSGHRPFVWTRDFSRAMKFGSAQDARTFALNALGHGLWDIGAAAPSDLPVAEISAQARVA